MNNLNSSLTWKFTSVLEDLDYTDDVALLSSRFNDIQEKTTRLHEVASIVRLKINSTKTKSLRLICKRKDQIKLNGELVEDVGSFTKKKTVFSKRTFSMLKLVLESAKFSKKTKFRILNSNAHVLSVLLCDSEMWRATKADYEKVDTFH